MFGLGGNLVVSASPLNIDEMLGFGSSILVAADLDILPISVGVGITGTESLDFGKTAGPQIQIGIGKGIPVQVVTEFSYTWEAYRFNHQEHPMALQVYLPIEDQDWENFDSWTGSPPQFVFGATNDGGGQEIRGGTGNGGLTSVRPPRMGG